LQHGGDDDTQIIIKPQTVKNVEEWLKEVEVQMRESLMQLALEAREDFVTNPRG
jgi:hypothetical protein